MSTNPTAVADVVSAEIIRSAFVATTDEMKTNLMRTAYNPIIYEVLTSRAASSIGTAA